MDNTIDTFGLECLMNNQLREHDFLTWVPTTYHITDVSNDEIYDALLNPIKSPYINTTYRTILQSNATVVNLMFYSVYCGYLYAAIRSNDSYDNNIWTYEYMHKKLNENIYAPIFISLLPQILDYDISDTLKKMYIKESRDVFSLVLRCIFSVISQSDVKNNNLYEKTDRNSEFYKNEFPKVLNEMHEQGTFIFFDSKHTRLKGKNLTSSNLWEDLNLV